MQITVFVGEDDLASLKAAGGGDTRVISAEDGGRELVEMLCTPSLFGPPPEVLVRGFEHLEPQAAQQLAGLEGSLVATGAKAPGAKIRKVLGERLLVVELKARDRAAVALEQFSRHGVTLDAEGRRFVTERLGSDLWRARSVAQSCALAEVKRPSVRMLGLLAGSSGAEAASWDVTDALVAGAVGRACALAEQIEPVALSTYLAGELLRWAVIAEAGGAGEEAQRLVGGAPWQLKRQTQHAKRFGAERLRAAARRAAALDADLRGEIPGELREAGVSLALCEIAAALHR